MTRDDLRPRRPSLRSQRYQQPKGTSSHLHDPPMIYEGVVRNQRRFGLSGRSPHVSKHSPSSAPVYEASYYLALVALPTAQLPKEQSQANVAYERPMIHDYHFSRCMDISRRSEGRFGTRGKGRGMRGHLAIQTIMGLQTRRGKYVTHWFMTHQS